MVAVEVRSLTLSAFPHNHKRGPIQWVRIFRVVWRIHQVQHCLALSLCLAKCLRIYSLQEPPSSLSDILLIVCCPSRPSASHHANFLCHFEAHQARMCRRPPPALRHQRCVLACLTQLGERRTLVAQTRTKDMRVLNQKATKWAERSA